MITQNQQPHLTRVKPQAGLVIPQKWLVVVQLHLAGKKVKEIAEMTGYTENSVYRILNHEDVNFIRQQLLETTQQEFEALFAKVVDAIRGGLDDPDPKVQALYTAQWLKAHGKISDKGGDTNVTAENVVMQILNAKKE